MLRHTAPEAGPRADRGQLNLPRPPSAVPTRRDSSTAAFLVIAVAILMQVGAALAVMVIESVGVVQALWLRTFFAALPLIVVRPRYLRLPERGHRLVVAGLGAALLVMNLCFFEAISRAPVGIVVAVEFLGPLGVAVVGSRRLLDVIWVILAAGGIAILAGPTGSVNPVGLAFAFGSAAGWAAFLLMAKQAVNRMEPLRATTLMLLGSSLVLTPLMLATGVRIAGESRALLLGVGVGLIVGLAYFLELAAIRRVRASTYGVLLSIEPAIAALTGFLILSQHLTVAEIGAIAAIIVAAGGASWTAANGRKGI